MEVTISGDARVSVLTVKGRFDGLGAKQFGSSTGTLTGLEMV